MGRGLGARTRAWRRPGRTRMDGCARGRGRPTAGTCTGSRLLMGSGLSRPSRNFTLASGGGASGVRLGVYARTRCAGARTRCGGARTRRRRWRREPWRCCRRGARGRRTGSGTRQRHGRGRRRARAAGGDAGRVRGCEVCGAGNVGGGERPHVQADDGRRGGVGFVAYSDESRPAGRRPKR